MSENEETNDTAPAAPAWMATQAPKEPATKAVDYVAPKTRNPRRTRAQMLADAAARPDAEIPIVTTVQPTGDAAKVMGLATLMAAEDHRDAVVRDVSRIVRNEHSEYLATRLPIIAIVVALLALATALVAIVK